MSVEIIEIIKNGFEVIEVVERGPIGPVGPVGPTAVTSVGISGSDGIEVDSGSPVTGAGTITLGINAATLRSHINVADGAEVNVNADWNATTGDAQILNKPSFNTGKTIYVDAGVGTDTRTGLSKYDASKPFLTIAAAVAASAVGDLVWVRNGSYTITSTIDLNNKGNTYFEPNTTVVVPNGIVAFTYSTNSASAAVSIDGQANFFIQGSGGLIQKGGASVMYFRCKSILDLVPASPSAKILFSCTGGTFFVNAEAITTPSASVFQVTDTDNIDSVISANVPYIIGGNVIDVSGTSTPFRKAGFSGDFWSIGSYGQPVKITGSANASILLRSVIYRFSGLYTQPAIRLISNSNAYGHGIIFRGGTIREPNNNPAVGIEGDNWATGRIAFMNTMFQTNTNVPCISSDRARNVSMTTCYAQNSASSETNIVCGSLVVDPDFDW
jgi:hypothetical protein